MKWISPSVRISFSLVCIAISLLFVALAGRLGPHLHSVRLQQRQVFCEQLAMHCSLVLGTGDVQTCNEILLATVRRHADVESAGLRTSTGKLVVKYRDHPAAWDSLPARGNNTDLIQVPVAEGEQQWGTLEVRFQKLHAGGVVGVMQHPAMPVVVFFAIGCFLAFWLYIRFVIRNVNFTQLRAMPCSLTKNRNGLIEGVVLLDNEGQIVVANEAFAAAAGCETASLAGKNVSELRWIWEQTTEKASEADFEGTHLPWEHAREGGILEKGVWLAEDAELGAQANFIAQDSMPLVGDDASVRRAFVSFEDLSEIEKKNAHLRKLLRNLRKSRREVERQNKRLLDLATKDPLTGCLNRRAYFTEFEAQWSASQRYDHPLSCLMVDIDHFKLVNDNHGHGTGDQVLQQLSAVLREEVRQSDFVCRYGGEEFSVLLPHLDVDKATLAAERLRAAIENRKPLGLSVTASIGVSGSSLGAENMQELLDQADKCLYVAKRGGRNRVVCWNEVPADQTFEPEQGRPFTKAPPPSKVAIPFHAVTALLAALGYRHTETAEHSRRVADLCVAAANGLFSHNECYILEVAALLHDVGKLGVPDAILLKPGKLSKEEWKILKTHEAIGEEIIAAAFSSDELSEIIQYHHLCYGEEDDDEGLHGKAIPLGARLLKIADAYDSMTTNQVYRKGRTSEEAFAELRHHAGTQFDPDLVEHFVKTICDRKGQSETRSATDLVLSLNKRTALQIGLQLEKLAIAVDVQDRASLIQMVDNLHVTATEEKIDVLAEKAARLKENAENGTDMDTLTAQTLDLIELCRSIYQAYLPGSETETIVN